MSCILLFGGAFNPVHREHVALAKAAVKKFNPQKLFVIPTAVSPHKSGAIAASDADRLSMCRLAFADIPCAEVSDYEISQGGVSYSYITCEHFKSLYPNSDIYFLMGGDMLASFSQWKNPRRILSCATLAACARENASEFEEYIENVARTFGVKVESVQYTGDSVSSTRIRALTCLGGDISAYVLPSVCQYIKSNKLYYNSRLASVAALEKKSRWEHSLRVAVMCARNAARAGLAEEQAVTMAALHDVAKNLPPDSPYLKGFVPPEGVPSPVIHQYSGAYVAQNHFGLSDENLLNAIRYHTSGRPGMSAAEMLLYLCDMLEEGRNFNGVDKLRHIFNCSDLPHAMLASLEYQICYLKACGGDIYPLTEQAYSYLKELLT